MVLSVFAGAIAFTGTAAAADNRSAITTDTVVYQGEDLDDLPTDASTFLNNESGEPLEDPIPTDATTGAYFNGSITLTVATPRITDFDLENTESQDVAGGELVVDDDASTIDGNISVDYNFDESEDIEITVTDADGIDVTNEILNDSETNPKTGAGGTVTFEVNPDIRTGEFTFTAEGEQDLDFGDATQSITVTFVDDLSEDIALAQSEVVQGETVSYTVSGVDEGASVTVAVDEDDALSGASASDIFRSVGDVDTVSSGGGYLFAQLTMDGGQAVGSIDTDQLETDTVAVDMYVGAVTPDGDEDETVDLTVTDGSLSLTSPTGAYVIGSRVSVAGTASSGIDDIALYVRDTGDWELVQDIDGSADQLAVDPDGSFSKSDVRLSDVSGTLGNKMLSLSGSYRIAVVDADQADTDDNDAPDDTLNSTAFADITTDTASIVAQTSALTADFVTYNGQIAEGDDTIDIDGVAQAAAGDTDGILVVLVGPRGAIDNTTVSVDDDGSFDTDHTISGLSKGSVSVHVISPGRDGTIGNSGQTPAQFDANLSFTGTADQVRAQVLADTVDDTASDDEIVSGTFRYANKLTTIASVPAEVAAGETLTVSGETNRNPSDATIIVEVFNANDESVALASTDEWGTDGSWSVDIPTDELSSGAYTVESDDGDNSDIVAFDLVDEVTTPAPEPGGDSRGDPRLRPARRAHRAGRRRLPRAAQTRLNRSGPSRDLNRTSLDFRSL
jgi:major cell surface glycoprotein (TIGR04216 family)